MLRSPFSRLVILFASDFLEVTIANRDVFTALVTDARVFVAQSVIPSHGQIESQPIL